jgi:hypothetical protein
VLDAGCPGAELFVGAALEDCSAVADDDAKVASGACAGGRPLDGGASEVDGEQGGVGGCLVVCVGVDGEDLAVEADKAAGAARGESDAEPSAEAHRVARAEFGARRAARVSAAAAAAATTAAVAGVVHGK